MNAEEPQIGAPVPDPLAFSQASTPTGTGPDSTSPASTSPNSTSPAKARPRTSAIVWGTLILVFCAFVASREMGGTVDPTVWIIGAILGIGALLLIVGIAIVLRGPRGR